MADNYLERKYEELQQRKLHGSGSARKPHATPFKVRRVLVTGGAQGIGKAIVRAFCADGNRVAFLDCNTTLGREVERFTGARFFPVDVTDVAALEGCVQQLLAEWGDIDVIVNNVGVCEFKSITEISVADFDRVLHVNLRSAFVTSRLLALHRQRQSDDWKAGAPGAVEPNNYGRIINMCSTRYLMSEPGSEAYAASKGGIYSLTHALALSLSDYHITVNCLSPGWIQNTDYDQLRPVDHDQHPSRRVGKPEDIARMCLFLCRTENDFINGENFTIDGGMTKKMIYEP